MSNSEKITNNDDLMLLYLKKMEEVLTLKSLNEKLLDANHNLLIRNIEISRKNNIPIGCETQALIAEVRSILHQMHDQPKMNNPRGTPSNGAAPQLWLCCISGCFFWMLQNGC